MACRIFQRSCPASSDPATRVTGAHRTNKESRVTKLPGAWRAQEGLSFDMIIGSCTCPVSTNRIYFYHAIPTVYINVHHLSPSVSEVSIELVWQPRFLFYMGYTKSVTICIYIYIGKEIDQICVADQLPF